MNTYVSRQSLKCEDSQESCYRSEGEQIVHQKSKKLTLSSHLLVLGSVGSANGDIEERHEKIGGRDIIKREKIATTRAKYD